MELSKSKAGLGGGLENLENDLLELISVSCTWWAGRHKAEIFIILGGASRAQKPLERKQRELSGNLYNPWIGPALLASDGRQKSLAFLGW